MSVLDLLSRVLGLEAGRLVEESATAREILCCVNLECIASYTNRDTIRDEKNAIQTVFHVKCSTHSVSWYMSRTITVLPMLAGL